MPESAEEEFADEDLVQIRRAATSTDPYGDPVPGDYADHILLSGRFAPSPPAEPVEVGRNAILSKGIVYVRDLPSPPDIEATDRASIRGVEYELDGDVGVWRRDDSWAIQFAVKRAQG